VLFETPKSSQPVAKETVAVLTTVCVSIADDVALSMTDAEMIIDHVALVGFVMYAVLISTEDR
jgi:hypothetical protein